jgi:hypothetical protein
VLDAHFVFVAIFLWLAGGAGYVLAVIQGRASPNLVTWLLWGVTPLIAFTAQLRAGVGVQAWMTFALSLAPLAIVAAALAKGGGRWTLTRFDVTCGALALTGLICWQATQNPLLALIFSITADLFAGLPTVLKAHRAPHTEIALPYLISLISMAITLLTITDWVFAQYAFPAYVFGINVVVLAAIKRPRRAGATPATECGNNGDAHTAEDEPHDDTSADGFTSIQLCLCTP